MTTTYYRESKTQLEEFGQNTSLSIRSISADKLCEKCSMESFIHTEENTLAYKLFSEIEAKPKAETVNPVFLFGPSGSGKSHLMMALATSLKDSGQKVHYVRATTFSNHFSNATRFNQIEEFRNLYDHVDILLIDDIHELASKNSTQQEVLSIFDSLYAKEKKIIFSSVDSPNALRGINSRLINRFEWGVSIPMEQVSPEKRENIVIQKAEQNGLDLPPKVVAFLLSTFTKSVKMLNKAIETLAMKKHVSEMKGNKEPLDLFYAKKYLAKLMDEEQHLEITPIKITEFVAKAYNIHPDDILSKSRVRTYVMPRQIAMYFCRKKLSMPFKRIGEFFNRDHSTVITSTNSIQDILDSQKPTSKEQRLVAIVSKINGELDSLC